MDLSVPSGVFHMQVAPRLCFALPASLRPTRLLLLLLLLLLFVNAVVVTVVVVVLIRLVVYSLTRAATTPTTSWRSTGPSGGCEDTV